MHLIKRLFLQTESKAVLVELQLIVEELMRQPSAFGTPEIGNISAEIRRYVYDHPKDVKARVRAGDTPRGLAFNTLLNRLGRKLASGQYHTYRGVLSMSGTGMLSAFVWLLRRQESEGTCSASDVAEAMKIMREQIAGAG